MADTQSKNLDVGSLLAGLNWDSKNADVSLNKLYEFACDEGKRTEDWYWKKTGEKKRWAMLLRVVAIMAVTAAGIIPILSPIFKDAKDFPIINPIWSSLAIAIGTAALGLDKFFGFSSGWIRYVTSALNIKAWLIEFKFDWEQYRATIAYAKDTDTEAQLQIMITKCSMFAIKIATAVQEETKQWAQEFQSSLSTLDQTLKQQAADSQPTGITINLENGDQCPNGWEVAINGRKSGTHYGNTGVLTNLYPGLYQIVVSAETTDKTLHAEAAVKISAGEVETVNLKLA